MKYFLTATAAKNAKPKAKPYKLADGGGLYLLISVTGAKLWRYKYRIGGREGTYAIGAYPQYSISMARVEHAKARDLVSQGISPRNHRTTQKLKQIADAESTFAAIAADWIAKTKTRWSPYYLKQVERSMASDVFPRIGSLPIKQVTSAHLLQILKTVEGRGAETVALLIRQWCSAVFRYAAANLLVEGDPAVVLRGAVTRSKVKHNAPLPAKEIPALLAAVTSFSGNRTTAIAIELLLLTFVRTVELRKAEWGEIDFEKKLWRVPAQRMKMKIDHLVPLSSRAVDLLIELRVLTGSQKFLFPNSRKHTECMSATTINRALERMGYRGKLSAHGFRSTASTLLHEMDFPSQIIERQLAHAERDKVKASYNHADFLPQRIKMMQHYADFVYAPGGNPVVHN
jgi:integrase